MRAVILIASACLLSGCAVYQVAATGVDVTTTILGVTSHVVGAVITAPFPDAHSEDKPKDK